MQEFLDTWKTLRLTERMREVAKDPTLTLEDFLAAPEKYLRLLSDTKFNARFHLIDRQTYRMGQFHVLIERQVSRVCAV